MSYKGIWLVEGVVLDPIHSPTPLLYSKILQVSHWASKLAMRQCDAAVPPLLPLGYHLAAQLVSQDGARAYILVYAKELPHSLQDAFCALSVHPANRNLGRSMATLEGLRHLRNHSDSCLSHCLESGHLLSSTLVWLIRLLGSDAEAHVGWDVWTSSAVHQTPRSAGVSKAHPRFGYGLPPRQSIVDSEINEVRSPPWTMLIAKAFSTKTYNALHRNEANVWPSPVVLMWA